jgi:membrane-associated protease RseP (regulator of RpoE activity)
MKTKQFIAFFSVLLFTTSITFCSEPATNETHPVIGIGLDTSPLPELLIKHLGLQPGQGMRIANVMKNSAADEAGLERDDILINFNGKNISNRDILSSYVNQEGAGKEITIEIIHLGQHKTITLKLKSESENQGWKYPEEPQSLQTFQPGKIFLKPQGSQDWQIFDNQIPNDLKSEINSIFNELYSYHYTDNGKQYSVTINGSPDDNNSTITIKVDNDQYKTTIGELDKIPEKYREVAKNAIEDAKQNQSSKNSFGSNWFEDFDNLFPNMNSQGPQLKIPDDLSSSNPFFQKMEEQMKQMREQMEELQKNQNNLLNQLREQETQK